jgi:hypothetical protein
MISKNIRAPQGMHGILKQIPTTVSPFNQPGENRDRNVRLAVSYDWIFSVGKEQWGSYKHLTEKIIEPFSCS